MTNRFFIFLARGFSFLDDRTKRNLRKTSKEISHKMRELQVQVLEAEHRPCQTKTEFVIRTNFLPNLYEIQRGWRYYKQIVANTHRLPAILYKLTDSKVIETENQKVFARYGTKGSTDLLLGIDGRIYWPGNYHTPFYNWIWLIANIDSERAFLILSPLSDLNVSLNDVSPFAEEIALLKSYGYGLELSETDQLVLKRPEKLEDSSILLSKSEKINFFRNTQIDEIKLRTYKITQSLNRITFFFIDLILNSSKEDLLEAIVNLSTLKTWLFDDLTKVEKDLIKHPELFPFIIAQLKTALPDCSVTKLDGVLKEKSVEAKITKLKTVLLLYLQDLYFQKLNKPSMSLKTV